MGDTKMTAREAVERLREALTRYVPQSLHRNECEYRACKCGIAALKDTLAATADLAPDDADALRAEAAELRVEVSRTTVERNQIVFRLADERDAVCARAEKAERERDEARRAHIVPGHHKCDPCGFVLVRKTLDPETGEVGGPPAIADAAELACPNGCGAMRPATYKDIAAFNAEAAKSQVERAYLAERALAEQAAVVEALRGALRSMADRYGPAADHHADDCPEDPCHDCVFDARINHVAALTPPAALAEHDARWTLRVHDEIADSVGYCASSEDALLVLKGIADRLRDDAKDEAARLRGREGSRR